jgi:ABC-type antimicrobial peptide transport system ATPase subunit
MRSDLVEALRRARHRSGLDTVPLPVHCRAATCRSSSWAALCWAHPTGAVPPLIVANQPTWGLDIGAVAYVHQQLLDAAPPAAAVLVISEDLDEVFALADRIAVMHHGPAG